MKAIDVQQLEKTYSNGVHALKGVDLTIQDGDFLDCLERMVRERQP